MMYKKTSAAILCISYFLSRFMGDFDYSWMINVVCCASIWVCSSIILYDCDYQEKYNNLVKLIKDKE